MFDNNNDNSRKHERSNYFIFAIYAFTVGINIKKTQSVTNNDNLVQFQF